MYKKEFTNLSLPANPLMQISELYKALMRACQKGFTRDDINEDLINIIRDKINDKLMKNDRKIQTKESLVHFFLFLAYKISKPSKKSTIGRNKKIKKNKPKLEPWQEIEDGGELYVSADDLPNLEYDYEFLKKLGIEEPE